MIPAVTQDLRRLPMIRRLLIQEILLPYAAFALLGAAALVLGGGAAFRHSIDDGLAKRLEAAARAVAARDEVFLARPAEWRADLDRLSKSAAMRFTVIDGSGTPISDSARDAARLGNFLDLPEIREAARSGAGVSRSEDGSRMAVAVAARDSGDSAGGTLLGFVRTEVATAEADAMLSRWWWWSAGLSLSVAGLGLIGIWWTASRLSKPIESFARSAAELAGNERALDRARSMTPLSRALADLVRALVGKYDHLTSESASLKTEIERISAVLTSMAEGVIATGRDERILFANPAATLLLDLPDSKLTGRPLWEAVRVPAIVDVARAAIGGRETRQLEVELPRTETVLAVHAGCLPGEPCPGVVLVLHDVTDLRRLENVRREFVSNVSHELKTPLASIQAYTETLLEGALDDSENNVRFLKRIAEQADRLHGLILDLLRLARIEAGTDVFDIKRLNAGKVIQPCVEEHAAIAKTKGVTLEADSPADPLRIRADPDGLRTILDNLLDNAVNYTAPGGRVLVRWRDQSDGMAVIEVADTGIGIPAEHIPRIFERFHRVDRARSREHGGTGLGLAIVKHLVQVFEGRVEVESEVGRGSTFRVLLPTA